MKPQAVADIDEAGKVRNTSKQFEFFVRPPPNISGVFEPRVYHPGYCSTIIVLNLGKVKRNPAVEYALYLLEVSKEMVDQADSATRHNRFGLAMHYARFSIEFSAKSIFSVAGENWPQNKHDVSDSLRDKKISNSYKAKSVSLEQIAWDVNLWANPPRMDLYGNPKTFTEPSMIIPLEEVETVRHRALEIYAACLQNFELNHLDSQDQS